MIMRPRIILANALLASICSVATATQTTQPVRGTTSIQEIIKIWKERQERADSFDFTWEGTKLDRFMPTPPTMAKRPKSAKPTAMPEQSWGRFVVDSRLRFRHELAGKRWAAEKGEFLPRRHTYACDGRILTTLFDRQPDDYPWASIKNAAVSSEDLREVTLVPLRMVFRPFDTKMSVFEPSKLLLTDALGIVDNRKCLILEHQQNKVWVDPTMDYMPVRYYEIERGRIRWTYEMGYHRDPQIGWVPSSWRCLWTKPDGDILFSETARVTAFNVNAPIPDETFQVSLPVGTYVVDSASGEKRVYILRAEGDKRPVLESEFGMEYIDLLHSDPPGTWIRRWLPWILVVSTALLVVVIARGYWRRRVNYA